MNAVFLSGKINFKQQNVQRFLNPRFVFVGAHFSEIKDGIKNWYNQMPEFCNRGIWENGYGRSEERYNKCIDALEQGDILVVKKLNGRTVMKIIALGVVIGFPVEEERTLAFVSWSIPKCNFDLPLKLVGTIEMPRELNSFSNPTLLEYIEKCRTRFLLKHLQEITHYLYQE